MSLLIQHAIFNQLWTSKNLMAFNKKSDTSCENPLGFWPKGFPGLKKTQAALRCGIVGHVPTGRSHWPSWNPRNGLIYRGRRKPQAGVSAASLNWKSALQECCIQLWPTGRTKGFWSDSLHIFAASQSEVNYPKTKNRKLVVSVVPTHPTKTLWGLSYHKWVDHTLTLSQSECAIHTTNQPAPKPEG